MNRRREPCYHCRRWQGYWVRQAVPKVRVVNPLGDYKFQQSKLSEETGGIILVVYSNLAIVLTWLGEVSESLKLNVEHPLTDSQVWDSDSGYFTARVSKGQYESGNQILFIWKKKELSATRCQRWETWGRDANFDSERNSRSPRISLPILYSDNMVLRAAHSSPQSRRI